MRNRPTAAAHVLLAALVASAAGFWNLPVGVCCMPGGEEVAADCGGCCHHGETEQSHEDAPVLCECDVLEASPAEDLVTAPLPAGPKLRLFITTPPRRGSFDGATATRPPDLSSLQRWLC